VRVYGVKSFYVPSGTVVIRTTPPTVYDEAFSVGGNVRIRGYDTGQAKLKFGTADANLGI